MTVVGVDPAAPSLDVARTKPYADRVTWINGDATALASVSGTADMVVMTGNVAQVFVSDADWSETLTAVHAALRPGGWFVFEIRPPPSASATTRRSSATSAPNAPDRPGKEHVFLANAIG